MKLFCKELLFVSLFLIFSSFHLFSQESVFQGNCTSEIYQKKLLETDLNYKLEIETIEKLIVQKRASKINTQIRGIKTFATIPTVEKIYKIPVVVHVVHRGEPIGEGVNISDDHIRAILKQSNQDYRKTINSTGFGNGFDTNVEFALAVRDPNGNLTNGIERIDMSNNASYMALGLNSNFSAYFDSIVKYNLFPKKNYMNIWIVSGADGGNWVAFGGGGIVCVSAYVFNLHGTVSHELGHEMSLDHTFAGETQNTDGTFNCPPVETDPYTQGDRCGDTPRHTEFSQSCNGTFQNPCYPGDPSQVDDLYETNYMAYGRCGKGNYGMFSNDQKTRIRAKAEYRSNDHVIYNQLVPPNLPVVNFLADNTVSTDINAPISFFEKSQGVPNSNLPESEWPNIHFSWEFKNGSTTYTSNKQNPVMSFSVPGYYDVTLTITTSLGVSTNTKQQYIFVQSQPITPVCSIDFVEGAYYHSVHSVKFNDIYKETRIDFSDTYLDLRSTNNTLVKAGQTYPLILNVRGEINRFQHVKVYIDYNDNGSFEDDELIFKGLSTSDFQYFNTNVTIPLNSIRNRLLTMRVIAYSGDGPNNCGRIGDSDVEDYGVVIKGDCTSDLIEFSTNNIASYAGSTIQFHDNSCVSNQSIVNSISYRWTFTNGLVTYSSNEQHPSVTFLQLGIYNVSLTITTPLGTNTLVKENFINITNPATAVCSTFTGSVNYYLYRSISKVVFNTINKETPTRTNEGYKDFRNTNYTVVKEGATYPLSLNLGTSGGDMARYKVFIDYNNNGTFEDSELVVTGTSTSSSVVTLRHNITIPYSSIKNRMLTMRVMTSPGDIASSCSNIPTPDVEDYGLMITDNCNSATIDFDADKKFSCSNTTINFTDKSCIPFSTNFNNYIYQWIFTSGTNSYTSSEQYPSINFIQTGVYSVTLNIHTPDGIKTLTKEGYIKIAEAPIVVCNNITSIDGQNSRNINRVIFNTIDKKTSTSINEGYQDFRCTNTTLVKAGQTYPLTISISSTSFLERFKVYIDYNNDGIFLNSELVFEGKAVSSYTIESFSKNIIIPSNFVKNTILTMRVIGNSEDINSTCGSFKNADIEDYGIMIENNGNTEIIDFISNETLGFINQKIKFIDQSVFPFSSNFDWTLYTYQWEFDNGSKVFTSTDQDPSIIFDQLGVYSASLKITTLNGVKTLFKDNYIKIVEPPLVVCNTITSNNSYSYRNINHVTFNTIDKKTSTSINEGYQDYRLSDTTRLLAGQSYPLTITTSSSAYSLENYKVYIDYNNDAIFSSSELVFEGVANTNSSTETFTKNILIPINSIKNIFLTMRVIGDAKSITSTCGAFDNPDIEDYSVYIYENNSVEVIDFNADKLYGTLNSVIIFYDISSIPFSTNFNNYTYEWSITNGIDTYNSNSQYPSITFAQPGVYSATLNITTPLGIKSITKEKYIRITESPSTVCTISPSSGTWYNRAISKVVFNTISKETPTNINEVYKDFRNTDNTIVKCGLTYPITLNIGTTNNDKARYKVYIDFNNSSTFDDTEVVFSGTFSGTSSANASGILSKDILIPTNAVRNKLLTMRVMTAVSDIASACSAMTVPDVEDYGLIILSNTLPPSVTSLQNICPGKTVASLEATGSNIKWYATPLWGSALASTTLLNNGATYYATQTLDGEESSERLAVTITILQATISTSGPETFCEGGLVTLTSSAGDTYLWSTGETTQSINVSNAGNFSVTVTNSNSCLTTSSITNIIVNPLPTITGNLSTFVGANTRLIGSGSPSLIEPWISSNTSIQTVDATGDVRGISLGTSTVTYTNSYGCQVSKLIDVQYTCSIAGSITGGSTVIAGANSTILSVAGSNGNIQWQSSIDGISFSNINGENGPGYTALNLISTTYYRVVVINGACNPANTNSIVLTVVPPIVLTSPVNSNINESQSLIYQVVTSGGGTYTKSYSLSNTGDVSLLNISASGEVTLKNGYTDFDNKASYSFTININNGIQLLNQSITVYITNLDEVAPVFTSLTSGTATENQTLLYTASATDTDFMAPNTASSVSYTLKLGMGDVGILTINTNTGVVSLTSGGLDYETKSNYIFTIIASDAVGNTKEQVATVSVLNVDEVAPMFTSLTTGTATENQSVLYTASATDTDFIAPNTASSVSYALKVGMGDVGLLTINTSTGVVSLTSGGLDYETKNNYTFTVIANDAVGNTKEQVVTVSIIDIQEFYITYFANEGMGSMNVQKIIGGESTILTSNNYTRANAVFIGWATTASGAAVYSNTAQVNLSSDISLYAKWYSVDCNAVVNGGIITGIDSVYETSGFDTLTLTNYLGTIQSWEKSSTVDFSNFTIIGNTSDKLYLSTLQNSAYYRVRLKSDICEATSSIFLVSVVVHKKPVLLNPLNKSIKQKTSIEFNWSKVKDATDYTLRYGTSPGLESYTEILVSDTVKYLNNLVTNTKYYWTVRAHNGSFSDTSSFQTFVDVPEINSLNAGNKLVNIQWSMKSLSNIKYFKIFRNTSTSADLLIDSLLVPISTYTDTKSLILDRSYTYKIIAGNNENIESDFSISKNTTPFNTKPKAAVLNNQFYNNNHDTSLVSHTFSASNSSDEDGTIVEYKWFINDSIASSSKTNSSFMYKYGNGTTRVKLIVLDNDNAKDSATAEVKVTIVSVAISTGSGILGGVSAVNPNLIITADTAVGPMGNSTIYKMDRFGAVINTITVEGKITTTPVAGSDSSLYITSGTSVSSYDKNGISKWTPIILDGSVNVTPTVDSISGKLFVGTINNNFYTIDAKTGRIAWSVSVDAPIHTSAIITGDRKLVFVTESGTLYGFDLYGDSSNRSNVKWKMSLGEIVTKSGAIDFNQNIYFGTKTGNLIKIKLFADGTTKKVWAIHLGDSILSIPVIDGKGRVYVGTNDGRFCSVDPETGDIKWTFKGEGSIKSTSAISNYGTVIFATTNGNIYALDSNMNMKWTHKEDAPISANILYINNIFYFATETGKIFGLYDNPNAINVANQISSNFQLDLNKIKSTFVETKNEPLISLIKKLDQSNSGKATETPMWGTFQGNAKRTGVQVPDCPSIPIINIPYCFDVTDSIKISTSDTRLSTWIINDSLLLQYRDTSIMIKPTDKYNLQSTSIYGCKVIGSKLQYNMNSVLSEPLIVKSSNNILCTGDTLILSMPIQSDKYTWNSLSGSVINTTGSTLKITTTDEYRVVQVNSFGCKAASPYLPIKFNLIPKKPIITRTANDMLMSSSSYDHIWYKEGVQISDTSKLIKPINFGLYTTKSANLTCLSTISNSYYFLVTGILKLESNQYIRVNPNPFINKLNIDFSISGYQKINVELISLFTGLKVFQKNNIFTGSQLQIDNISLGTYILRAYTTDGKVSYQFKLIKL